MEKNKRMTEKTKETLMQENIEELNDLTKKPAPNDPSPGLQSVDVLVIGQGISGTFLSWYLDKAGLSFQIIDESKPHTASKAAAGIINPVTGRRMVKTWMIDELLPFVWDTYRQIENELNINCIAKKNIVDFFPNPQMRIAFLKRQEEDPQYLHKPVDENAWRASFSYDFGYGEIQPCYLVDVPVLLDAWRRKLIERRKLAATRFDINQLITTGNKIQYQHITAGKIIFCDGVESFTNPYFKTLPFAPNKGEALIVEIKDIPPNRIFKKGLTLAPLHDNLFWIGSSYEWHFENDQPTAIFRDRTEKIVQDWLRTPFKIMDHIAAVRPATLERRPFAGFHPVQKNVGILNGMGAKGCSLAPYFAKQLVQHLTGNFPLNPEADILRFKRILSKT
jgi:glycine/D-amino acid oxidase-like deaminating enzyme